jgi:hypothetical protein
MTHDGAAVVVGADVVVGAGAGLAGRTGVVEVGPALGAAVVVGAAVEVGAEVVGGAAVVVVAGSRSGWAAWRWTAGEEWWPWRTAPRTPLTMTATAATVSQTAIFGRICPAWW